MRSGPAFRAGHPSRNIRKGLGRTYRTLLLLVKFLAIKAEASRPKLHRFSLPDIAFASRPALCQDGVSPGGTRCSYRWSGFQTRDIRSWCSRSSQGGSVAKSLSMEQLKQFAAHGARARLTEVRAEIAAITRAFPDIVDPEDRAAGGRRRRSRGRIVAARTATTGGRRRRRRRGKLSAAGRAAISAAQKKRWASIRRKRATSEA